MRMRKWTRVVLQFVFSVVLHGAAVCAATLLPGAMAVTAQTAFAETMSIQIEGNRRVDAETVRSYFKHGPGGQLGPLEIDAGLKSLYATGLFEDVQIRRNGKGFTIVVVENAVINRIALEGNKRTKDDQLLSEIQSKPRATLSRPVVQSDVQRIVEIYRRNGRFDVRVVPKVIELPNNRVDLVFEITEGEKAGISKIIFYGNNAYSDSRLKDVVKTTETNWLSFLKNSDIYDPDRIEADRDLLRRFYLKHGYADVRIVGAVAAYDAAQKGFIITYTIEEGVQYKFGAVDIQSNVREIDRGSVLPKIKVKSGDIYSAERVEKSVEDISIEVAKRGYPFAQIRPRGDRDFQARLINIAFVLDEGARAYVERINIRGNVRTRDYVIRREFDISEGDAYNRALIDRAERRLKNLNFFKNVKITNEPGSAPDRVVVNVDVEEMSTGEFSISGGYSTADGWLAEVSVGERNLLGRGQYVRASVKYGETSKGFEVSFVEPYLLDHRVALGVDLFVKQTSGSDYSSYDTRNIGGSVRLGFEIREDVNLQVRYSAYQQEVKISDDAYSTCYTAPYNPDGGTPDLNPDGTPNITSESGCSGYVPALPVRMQLQEGAVITSLIGYSLIYNTLDSNKNPTQGMRAEIKQDVAGLGGDVSFMRATADARFYSEVMPDIVGVLRLQAGIVESLDGQQLRMLDHFQMGPNLVRGFRTNGLGPRDVTSGTAQDALGGSKYWGASLEFQIPLHFVPKDIGIRSAVFVDAGSVWDYQGPTSYLRERMIVDDENIVRSSVGASILWDSPFGPLRFDYAVPITKGQHDVVQEFRFGGGTKF